MTLSRYPSTLFPLATALLYYLGAYIGVHFAALESGIVVFWPPNAILLAALLCRPVKSWPPIVLAVIVAEVAADVPAFTVTEAVLFGMINATECMLAAALIRYARGGAVDWKDPADLGVFLVTVFFIASPLAAVGGASVYTFILGSDSPFLTSWRLWWIGDATGLIILTPCMHMMFSLAEARPGLNLPASKQLELLVAWVIGLTICFLVFSAHLQSENYLALTPLAVLLAPVWIGVRFSPLASSILAAVVALYAAFSTAAGIGPFIRDQQDQSALLTQEFTVLFTVLVLYIAAFVHQNRRKSTELELALSELRQLNEALEERVQMRTEELSEANQRLQQLALTDELTGIYNRRKIQILGQEEVERSQRTQRPFCILLLDLDHFKQINDRYGHDMGDRCLQAFALGVQSAIRTMDRFGRWGGEEFIIIVPESDTVDLARLSQKLLDRVRTIAVPIQDEQLSLSVSIGIAQWHHNSFDKLLSEADQALYRAKEQGRARAEFSTTETIPAPD
ncbi:diguanylate cyclase [Marinobacter mobilis]|uniref:diguanylate cyclase n=1 Tax=Marinobacter mobilis TaxID=488533 RepID=UPI0035C77743